MREQIAKRSASLFALTAGLCTAGGCSSILGIQDFFAGADSGADVLVTSSPDGTDAPGLEAASEANGFRQPDVRGDATPDADADVGDAGPLGDADADMGDAGPIGDGDADVGDAGNMGDADAADVGPEISPPPPPPEGGKTGMDLTAGGNVSSSPNYKLIGSLGEAPGGNSVSKSQNYTLKGGLVAATQ
jgi:hypothetical protein